LNVDDISGTVVEKRIEEVIAMPSEATQIYEVKKKDNDGSKYKISEWYSDDQIQYMKIHFYEML